jgi:regulator of RNase E activity RraA
VTQILDHLRRSCVATLTTVLRSRGITNAWMSGIAPLGPGQPRIAGPAFTLRFVPVRDDLVTADGISGPRSPRAAIERMPAGCITVVDAMGLTGAGAFGDIMCARLGHLGVAGLIVDGAVRDKAGIRKLGWPVWSKDVAGPPGIAGLLYADEQVPIACGGTTVIPGDIVVADEDGAVVVPQAIAAEVAGEAADKELFEEWALCEVQAGAPILGTYPPNEATLARYRTR